MIYIKVRGIENTTLYESMLHSQKEVLIMILLLHMGKLGYSYTELSLVQAFLYFFSLSYNNIMLKNIGIMFQFIIIRYG